MFRFYSRPGSTNRVAIAAEHSEGELKIAVARCSNNDSFNRKKGRMIAEGRLAKGKTFVTLPMESCSTKEFYEVATKIADKVSETKWYNLLTH